MPSSQRFLEAFREPRGKNVGEIEAEGTAPSGGTCHSLFEQVLHLQSNQACNT